ncbi:MAG: hypothetical protein ABSC48_10640 [Terracidiphilus sp.]|jgi:hypothetical protein
MARTIFGPVFGQITGQGGAIVQSAPITVPGLSKRISVHGITNVNSENRIERLIRNGKGLAPKKAPESPQTTAKHRVSASSCSIRETERTDPAEIGKPKDFHQIG